MKNLKLTFTNVDNLFDFVSCLQKEFTLFPAIQEINLIRQSVFETQIDQDTLSTPNLWESWSNNYDYNDKNDDDGNNEW